MLPLLLALPLAVVPAPRFTPQDALHAEWRRRPPVVSAAERAALPPADRARLDLALARIGAPGAPALLPPELETPTVAVWEAKAAAARAPEERFAALFMLNRLKSPRALDALRGLGERDAAAWPRPLHLEAAVAAARLNGGVVDRGLRAFLDALARAGKVDPTRAQAARLRLVLAGVERELPPPLEATPSNALALLDAWNRGPWDKRATLHRELLDRVSRWFAGDPAAAAAPLPLRALGMKDAPLGDAVFARNLLARLFDGLPQDGAEARDFRLDGWPRWDAPVRLAALGAVAKLRAGEPEAARAALAAELAARAAAPIEQAALLPGLRRLDPRAADALRGRLLAGSDPAARAAAIDDLPAAPADLEPLVKTLWRVEEYDGVQVLLPALEKWGVPVERRRELLRRFYDHPCWTARLDARRELLKLDPAAPWPAAPAPTAEDEALLAEAERLLARGAPVRLRIEFSGGRRATLRLDPTNAPINVADLARLAKRGFFDGRLAPRVVPDFVVQMGSPYDTMDGGPGYTVRCEDSLAFYGPGSVGMALSGKDTGGSQFFVATNAAPHLTGRYTRVGELEDPERALALFDSLELGARIERVTVVP